MLNACEWLMTVPHHQLIVLIAIYTPISVVAIGWMLWTVYVLIRYMP